MAPTRVTRAAVTKGSALPKLNVPTFGGKRAAERSPPKKQAHKRAALGDVTNKRVDPIAADLKQAIVDNALKKVKKARKQAKNRPPASQSSQETGFSSQDSNQESSQESSGTGSSEESLISSQDSGVDNKEAVGKKEVEEVKEVKEVVEEVAEKEEEDDDVKEDVFHDAVETLSDEDDAEADDSIVLLTPGDSLAKKGPADNNTKKGPTAIPVKKGGSSSKGKKELEKEETVGVKLHIEDVDKDSSHDIYLVSDYAQDIFTYYFSREEKFRASGYRDFQTDISLSMRGIVVDWMVEVQENFELNHETLYMAIRLMDLYLSKKKVSRDKLQLVAASALFIACKFDERSPPMLDDFLYVCDDAYKRDEYIRMEMVILKEIGFDIGMPSSYRFLRRFAKCGRQGLEILTLSRYILESSQLQYEFLAYKDSHLAAACLLLAMKMKRAGDWTPTLEYYTTYKQKDLLSLAFALNTMISLPPYKNLQTIKIKYSHKVFFEVAKIPALTNTVFKLVMS